MYGWLCELKTKITKKAPFVNKNPRIIFGPYINRATVKMIDYNWAYSSKKAIEKLRYKITPLREGLQETIKWYEDYIEKEKKIAQLWEKFFSELVKATQTNYDAIIPIFKNIGKPIERVVPVEGKIEVPQENVLPFEEVSKILEKYDSIGLAHCYCRHRKDLLDDPCKVTDERQNCFALGRAAEFTNSQGFTKQISKEEALRILKECEDLVC